MSTQADLAKLLDDAHDALQKIEGVAVSERNRVEEGIQHAQGAVASMVVSAPAAEAVPVVEKPQAAAAIPAAQASAPAVKASVEPRPAVGDAKASETV